MNNVHRSDYVEAIVAVALTDYGWTRKDPWDGWDCEHESGVRLEEEAADQREPATWEFYVIAERDLPAQKSLGLGPLQRLVSPCSFDQLGAAVERVRKALSR